MSNITAVDKSDRLGLFLTIGVVAIGIVAAVVSTVVRLIEVARGHDIPVLVPLTGQTAPLPLGPSGAPVSTALESGIVVVADPDSATLFALWAEPIVVGLAWSIALVIAALLCLRLARAQIFARGSAQLLYVAAGVVTAGWLLGTTFNQITTHGAFVAISGDTFDAYYFHYSLTPAIVVMVIAAVGVAVQAGERLQRETDGLV